MNVAVEITDGNSFADVPVATAPVRKPLSGTDCKTIRMRRTARLVAVVALVALTGCSMLAPTGAPLLTVDNQDDAEYRLTVSVLSGTERADDLSFRARDARGDARSVGVTGLRGNGSFRNVTLETDSDASSRVTVRPASTTTAAVNIWDAGDTTVYVVEATDTNASLAGVQVITCGSTDQEHELTVSNGTVSGRDVTCP